MARKIKVNTEEAVRLDVYLSQFFDVTRSQLQKQLKSTEIKLNGEEATLHNKVGDGDEIEIEAEPEKPSTEPIIPPSFPEMLYEDDDVVVVNKPAGLQVHQANDYDRTPTLAHAVLEKYPETASVGDNPEFRPGIVHRLDKDASGVLVIAKSQEAFEMLKKQFQERTTTKMYTVLVYGSLSHDHDFIRLRLERHKKKGKMVAHVEESEKGRDAETEYDVLDRFATTSLLKVQIHTGRTHQIRAHFLSIDHPVVGDKLYKKRKMTNIRPIELDRLFLHAAELTLTLPNGEEKTFTAPLPVELQKILDSQK